VIITAAAATVPPFLNFLIRPPGFEPQDLFTVRVNHRWADGGLVGDPNRAERMDAVLDVMDGLPHVQSAAAALALPFGEPVGASEFWRRHQIEGHDWAVGTGLFETEAKCHDLHEQLRPP